MIYKNGIIWKSLFSGNENTANVGLWHLVRMEKPTLVA